MALLIFYKPEFIKLFNDQSSTDSESFETDVYTLNKVTYNIIFVGSIVNMDAM